MYLQMPFQYLLLLDLLLILILTSRLSFSVAKVLQKINYRKVQIEHTN